MPVSRVPLRAEWPLWEQVQDPWGGSDGPWYDEEMMYGRAEGKDESDSEESERGFDYGEESEESTSLEHTNDEDESGQGYIDHSDLCWMRLPYN